MAALGLLLDVVGALMVLLEALYEGRMTMMVAGLERARKAPHIEARRMDVLTRLVEAPSRADRANLLRGLTAPEREYLLHLLEQGLASASFAAVILPWVWINRVIFRFTPWTDDADRRVHAYLWQLLGLSLIFAGFLLQLFAAIR